MSNSKKSTKTKVHAMTFDKDMYKILEDWRWKNRMTRSAAVNFILENFFSNLKDMQESKQREFNLKA